jgi:hypothetical protein
MKLLTFADGILRLGGEELPGILQSLSIDGKVRYDEQKVDGASGKSKTPQGWEDQTVKATLVLLTDDESDCYEKLSRLAPFFRQPDDKANPQIYTLANRHSQTRGIRQVVFDQLSSAESNASDTIQVTLGFVEHRPPIVRQERAQAKTPTPGEVAEKAAQAGQGDNAQPAEDAKIAGDLE